MVVDEQTETRAAQAYHDAWRGQMGAAARGPWAHPWRELPKVERNIVLRAIRAVFDAIDMGAGGALPPDGPNETNTQDTDPPPPAETVDPPPPAETSPGPVDDAPDEHVVPPAGVPT